MLWMQVYDLWGEEAMDSYFGQGHACIIGVGADLPCTVDDAKGLAKILKDPERCAYPEQQVHLLTEKKATRQQIIATLETLAETTNTESTVLVYFSGHGYQLTKPLKSYYLMPYGYDAADLSETAISGSELVDLLREIPAQKLLLLLDCCHAGGLTDLSGFQIEKAPLPPEAQRMFARGGGRMIIGSSLPDEFSYAGKPYSAFTTALLKGLCGKGANKQDGYVRAADLAMYASRVVPELTSDKQHPVLDIEKADNFVLAYYAGGQPNPKALPSELMSNPRIESEPGELNGQNRQTIASGDRSVAIGGDVKNSNIITGNGNVVNSSNVFQHGKYNINTQNMSGVHIGDTYGANPSDQRASSQATELNRTEASSSSSRKTILVLAANPTDLTGLALSPEIREIEESLDRSDNRHLFEVKPCLAVRPQDLRRALLKFKPQIVHFCGHGTNGSESNSVDGESRRDIVIPDESNQGGIFLEDETGKSRLVRGQTLTDLLSLFTDQLECVVLNSCYSEEQATLIVQKVPIVIGMNQAIGDKAAIEFSRGFYDGLGAGETIEHAFKLGCNAIDLQNIPEHLTPVIKHRDQTSNNTVKNVEHRGTHKSNTSSGQNTQFGDRYNLRESQGAIVNPISGTPITQQFGHTTNINTEGGDYAGGDLSK
jgi:uncharacterized caspase-like protein